MIEIDEDELINNDSAVRKAIESKLPPIANNKKRGHLRVESDDLVPMDAIEIKSADKPAAEEDKNHWTNN